MRTPTWRHGKTFVRALVALIVLSVVAISLDFATHRYIHSVCQRTADRIRVYAQAH